MSVGVSEPPTAHPMGDQLNGHHAGQMTEQSCSQPSSTNMSDDSEDSQILPPTVIGISIGREQSRLAASTTSAADKAAALQDGLVYFPSPLPQVDGNDSDDAALSGAPSDESQPNAGPSESPIHPQSLKEKGKQRETRSIRKSASTGSLNLHRALSTASSLGDDTRFENIQKQVNNRFKAIKDSLQDSFPNLPDLPNLSNLPNLKAILKVNNTSSKSIDTATRGVPSFSPTRQPEAEAGPSPLASTIDAAKSRLREMRAESKQKDKQRDHVKHKQYPTLDKALEQLTGDVVIMGGYRGSHLRSTEFPYRRVWEPPLTATVNLKKIDLEVGLDDEDEASMPQRIVSDSMLTQLGPIDISRRLIKRMEASQNAQDGKLRVHNYGYDWRLSPHICSQNLINFLQRLPCNSSKLAAESCGAIIIAHSLGGLITRHAVNQRPDLFAGVLYAGTPQHCVNVLGPLRKGDEILWSSKILTAQVNFSVRTSYALLPDTGKCFVDIDTKEELPVDFFNLQDWITHRFSPVIEPTLPALLAKPGLRDSITSIPRSVGEMMDNMPIIGRKQTHRKSRSDSKVPHPSNHRRESLHEAIAEHTGIIPQTHKLSGGFPRTTTLKPDQVVAPTLPRDLAIAYLSRTLARTLQFKKELAHNPSITYPPLAVMYSKSEPTVSGARVRGYDGISRADAYDNLIFSSGDGVVLAKAAMLPEGYRAVRGGVCSTERGHISLLGDLETVGRCLVALGRERRVGVGTV